MDFLFFLTESFQLVVGVIAHKRRQHQEFLKHYLVLKIFAILFFIIENAIYVPLICKGLSASERNNKLCSLLKFDVGVLIPWTFIQLMISQFLYNILKNSKRQQVYQQNIIIGIVHQHQERPSAERSEIENMSLEIESAEVAENPETAILSGITIESIGIPYFKKRLDISKIEATQPIILNQKKVSYILYLTRTDLYRI